MFRGPACDLTWTTHVFSYRSPPHTVQSLHGVSSSSAKFADHQSPPTQTHSFSLPPEHRQYEATEPPSPSSHPSNGATKLQSVVVRVSIDARTTTRYRLCRHRGSGGRCRARVLRTLRSFLCFRYIFRFANIYTVAEGSSKDKRLMLELSLRVAPNAASRSPVSLALCTETILPRCPKLLQPLISPSKTS